jgi:hypothetical protein
MIALLANGRIAYVPSTPVVLTRAAVGDIDGFTTVAEASNIGEVSAAAAVLAWSRAYTLGSLRHVNARAFQGDGCSSRRKYGVTQPKVPWSRA